MAVITMKQLLEVGAHFGHQAKRWNPKMKPYIFTERNGIHILDLHQTLGATEAAYEFVRQISEEGGKVLFVGTKKQAQEAVKEEAERAGGFYVNHRWLGGLLTNLETIKKRVKRLKELEEMDADGTLDTAYTKKEAGLLRKEMAKLSKNIGGIKELKKFQVNKEAMSYAKDTAIFLHCLPSFHDLKTTIGAEINEKFGLPEMEVTDEVFESPQSKVFDQAENRMHTIKAVMYATLK